MIPRWQSLCWSVDGFWAGLWLWAWQCPVLTVSWCLWYSDTVGTKEPGNDGQPSALAGIPDTIHGAVVFQASLDHQQSHSHVHKTLSVTKYYQMFSTSHFSRSAMSENHCLSLISFSAFKPCTQVVGIWIRASSTMVGIQAMTRSISQFLNRHSQSLSPATARPSHALQRHTGSGTFTDKETQKRLWKQEKNTFDLSHNWHFLFQLYGEWGRFRQ